MTRYVMMLDIETLSLRPDAAVTQIGWCVVNLDTGGVVEFNSAQVKVDTFDRHVDFDTVKWWMKQDKKVAESVFELENNDRDHAMEVFYRLKTIVDAHPDITVWGSPAMFDLPVLTSLWGGLKPWRYNYERDMMTLYKTFDPEGALKPPPNEMGHDAKWDAVWQASYLVLLNEKLTALGYPLR
jgi:hypothetical protein